ncbi:hypothetical protein DICPUDRAFT_159392 [Dictyostelium purpureum]|uniref:Right handed beta helix domain-containing protein n=1 Tax=Dictyostelium purpureum TaxID=5786 RepID=F1A407_DICPU|nr:uncharacterized protein DICPUDRAFT_159392 [Dictyostelium purpureum]EGC29071.1 hypothetical protein DICPUDRAFT_159392 [Dictyostelium purpureum]|eukprot:XP_003294403.1 hypothetical protein DICPUDRAFT_159392 [Dictyostelium purpureum]
MNNKNIIIILFILFYIGKIKSYEEPYIINVDFKNSTGNLLNYNECNSCSYSGKCSYCPSINYGSELGRVLEKNNKRITFYLITDEPNMMISDDEYFGELPQICQLQIIVANSHNLPTNRITINGQNKNQSFISLGYDNRTDSACINGLLEIQGLDFINWMTDLEIIRYNIIRFSTIRFLTVNFENSKSLLRNHYLDKTIYINNSTIEFSNCVMTFNNVNIDKDFTHLLCSNDSDITIMNSNINFTDSIDHHGYNLRYITQNSVFSKEITSGQPFCNIINGNKTCGDQNNNDKKLIINDGDGDNNTGNKINNKRKITIVITTILCSFLIIVIVVIVIIKSKLKSLERKRKENRNQEYSEENFMDDASARADKMSVVGTVESDKKLMTTVGELK